MSWMWAKLRSRRQTKGEDATEEKLVYPRETFETMFRRLQERIHQQGGRVLIDRPATRVERAADGGFLVHAGGRDSFRRGHDPREFEVYGSPRALRRGDRDGAD